MDAMHARRTISAIALAAAATVAVAACGGGSGATTSHGNSSGGSTKSATTAADNGVASKSPKQILDAAVKAADSAKSVHLQGTVSSGAVPIHLDLSIVTGTGATGSIAEGSASFKLVETGGRFYMQPNQAFLKKFAHSEVAAKLFEGRWLSGSSTGAQFRSFSELTSIKSLTQALVKGPTNVIKGATTTIAGQPAVALTDTIRHATLYVATTGQPYPLELTQMGARAGKVVFSQYNQPFAVTAPKNSIPIDQLGGGSAG